MQQQISDSLQQQEEASKQEQWREEQRRLEQWQAEQRRQQGLDGSASASGSGAEPTPLERLMARIEGRPAEGGAAPGSADGGGDSLSAELAAISGGAGPTTTWEEGGEQFASFTLQRAPAQIEWHSRDAFTIRARPPAAQQQQQQHPESAGSSRGGSAAETARRRVGDVLAADRAQDQQQQQPAPNPPEAPEGSGEERGERMQQLETEVQQWAQRRGAKKEQIEAIIKATMTAAIAQGIGATAGKRRGMAVGAPVGWQPRRAAHAWDMSPAGAPAGPLACEAGAAQSNQQQQRQQQAGRRSCAQLPCPTRCSRAQARCRSRLRAATSTWRASVPTRASPRSASARPTPSPVGLRCAGVSRACLAPAAWPGSQCVLIAQGLLESFGTWQGACCPGPIPARLLRARRPPPFPGLLRVRSSPVCPQRPPFPPAGTYLGAFGPHGPELLQLQRVMMDGEEWVHATKVTGESSTTS